MTREREEMLQAKSILDRVVTGVETVATELEARCCDTLPDCQLSGDTCVAMMEERVCPLALAHQLRLIVTPANGTAELPLETADA